MGYQDKLFALRQSGVKYSLEPMLQLAASLGHPERSLKFIHIAGTNGKGSVAAMCAAMARAAGLKVGLYTSPHLIRYSERFQINGRPIPEDRLEAYLGYFEERGWPGTFFEISTAVALLYFRDEKADLVVWETGMGGRLDATNIVTPLVTVLTPIGLDHTQMLGSTLAAIAAEKAAILKPCVPCVCALQEEEAFAVIRRRAAEAGCSLQVVGEAELDEFKSPLPGRHQVFNTALAVAAIRKALPGIGASDIREGLAAVRWPGRCQWIAGSPPLLLDGAHNPQAMAALAASLGGLLAGRPFALAFGAARDKDLSALSAILRKLPSLGAVHLVPLPHERGATPLELKKHFPNGIIAESWSDAWTRIAQDRQPTLVTGSLFLVAEVLRSIEAPDAALEAGERFEFKI